MDSPQRELALPEIALIAITRVALGAGIGLLLAQKLSESRRTAAGWALLSVGVATTVPLVMEVLGRRNSHSKDSHDLAPAR